MDEITHEGVAVNLWETLVIAGLVAVVVVFVAFMPWLLFWAIDVLFGHDVDVAWDTWFAAWVLVALFAGSRGTGKSAR